MLGFYSIIALIIGYVLDLIIGDPYFLWHPIRGVGNLIVVVEKFLRKVFSPTQKGERMAGVLLVIMVTGLTTLVPFVILVLVYSWNTVLGVVVESIMCYQLLATKSLKDESMKVMTALKGEGLDAGRSAVSMIVGRDTAALSEEGVVKATVETIAENTADGIIAPMFYMAIGGASLGFFYKAINTMDSMVGYKNDKYLNFGRVAAIFDDVANYIPARISAWLMIFASKLAKLNYKNALKIYRRDRYNHASPNSAHTESVMAGALGVLLAGDAYYFGKLYKKKTIGDAIRAIEIEDIKRANRLLYFTSGISIILLSVIKALMLGILNCM